MTLPCDEAQEGKDTQRNNSCSSAFSSPSSYSPSPPPSPPFHSLEWASAFFTVTHWDEGSWPTACACVHAPHSRPVISVSAWEPICAWAWCVSMSGCSCKGRAECGAEGEGRRGGWRKGGTGGDCLTWSLSSHVPFPPNLNPSTPLLFISTTADLLWFPLPVVHFKGN